MQLYLFCHVNKFVSVTGMKVILDFIPNHSSTLHPWFNESQGKKDNFTDYYVWHSGKNGGPPNNWVGRHSYYS